MNPDKPKKPLPSGQLRGTSPSMDNRLRRFLTAGELAGEPYVLSAPTGRGVGTTGSRLGNRAGNSLEFLDHRPYQPGDDLRHLDWSAYGRSDRLIVKMFQEEMNPHLDLIVDGSRSMALSSPHDGSESPKLGATLGMASLLARAAENAGFGHHLWVTGDDGCQRLENGRERPSHWRGLSFDGRFSPAESMSRTPPNLKPHGIRMFLSDLFWVGDPMTMLHILARNSAMTVIVQILAQSDRDPPTPGNVELVDAETDEIMDVFISDSSAKRYQEAFTRHQEQWRYAARQIGAFVITLTAETLLSHWMLEDFITMGILQVKA